MHNIPAANRLPYAANGLGAVCPCGYAPAQESSRQTCLLFASHVLALLYEKCSKQHINHQQSHD